MSIAYILKISFRIAIAKIKDKNSQQWTRNNPYKYNLTCNIMDYRV